MSASFLSSAVAYEPAAGELADSPDQAVNYLGSHWESWATNALRIAFILVAALVIRAVVVKVIDKLVGRMSGAHAPHGAAQNTLITGLLANAERRRQRSAAVGSVLRSVASFVILGTAAITVLPILGINLAPLLASAGVAGVAIGFGARNLVTDFLSGVFMIVEDQYGVGDQIDAGVATGTVLEVGLRVTKLRGADGEIWYVRNGEVKRIANMSQGWATATVEIPVGYDEDLARVERVVLAAAEEMGGDDEWGERLWEPVKVLGVDAMSGDGMVLAVSAKTMPGQAGPVARELRRRIKVALDLDGVRLAGAPEPPELPPGSHALSSLVSLARTGRLRVPGPVPDIDPPSVLGDPNSAQSRAASPLPPPER